MSTATYRKKSDRMVQCPYCQSQRATETKTEIEFKCGTVFRKRIWFATQSDSCKQQETK